MSHKFLTFPDRESKNLEFKSKLPQFNVLIKTCIAFANGFGGKIVIGVEDQTKRIIGIKDKDRDHLYDEFLNSLYDSVSPTLMARIWEKRFNDISVLIIDIFPSPKKPYFIKSEGIPKGVYIRVGSSTRRANDDYVQDLIREGQRITFDEEPIHQPLSVLSKELIKEFYGRKVIEKHLLIDKMIVSLPANNERYFPSIAGVLFFCQTPHLYIPEATILCTRFKGDNGRDIFNTEELTGPLDQVADQAYVLACSWLKKDYKLKNAHLKGTLPIPKEALREAIVNALIHRKYSIPGAVKIAIYDHRCEVFNPGNFPGVVDIESLGDGTTYLRNPTIARIARKMGLVEKLGSGIRLIFDSFKKVKLKKPVYAEGGDFVKVTFFFEPERQYFKSDEDAILKLIKMRQKLSIKDVMLHLNVSRNTATRKLNKLLKKRKLIRRGKGPSVKYYIF